jgi:protein-S-isoprenylcysteine O-methyltransferase Ste14
MPSLNSLELRIPPPLVTLIVGGLMWGIAGLGPVLTAPESVRITAALVVFAAGFAIAIAGVISFRLAKTTVNPLKPDTATSLVSSGVYRVTRNPMYLGLLVALVAWALYLASPVALIGLPAFWLYITRFQIIPEERVLAKLFGDSFTAYAAKVRRWI